MNRKVVCCGDCIHRPQWNGTVLAPPGFWGEWESEVDWSCPLVDKEYMATSWYMADDFFCPNGETAADKEERESRGEELKDYRPFRKNPEK